MQPPFCPGWSPMIVVLSLVGHLNWSLLKCPRAMSPCAPVPQAFLPPRAQGSRTSVRG
jgi:hypothetical protein